MCGGAAAAARHGGGWLANQGAQGRPKPPVAGGVDGKFMKKLDNQDPMVAAGGARHFLVAFLRAPMPKVAQANP